MSNTIITIARSYGSGGRTIGRMLAEKCGIPYYDRNLIYLASSQSGIDTMFFSQNDESVKKSFFDMRIPNERNKYVSKDELFRSQSRTIREVADKSDCVIIGRCADYILKNSKHKVIRAFIWAPEQVCVQTVMDKFMVSEDEARKTVKQINRHREEYYKYHTGSEWSNAKNYDLCFDTSRMSYEQITLAIEKYTKLYTEIF